jgi:hypothetical protein
MPVPIFGANEVDQNPNSVSLPATPGGASFWQNYFSNGATAMPAATVAFNTTNADAARGWQQQFMQDLQQQAAGNPNSRAQNELKTAYGDARAGQSALGSSARGTGGGAGLRQGVVGAGNVQRGYAGDAATLMLQEQQGAQALLAQQLAATRAQDAAQAQAQAQNTLGNTSLDQMMRQFYESQGLNFGAEQTQLDADRGRARLGMDLEAADTASRFANKGVKAGATMFGALSRGSRPKSSQETIDDAFNGE